MKPLIQSLGHLKYFLLAAICLCLAGHFQIASGRQGKPAGNSSQTVNPGKMYSAMSETEKKTFIQNKSNEFLKKFGQSGGIPPSSAARIKVFVDDYLRRASTRPLAGQCRFGDNLTNVLRRGSSAGPSISQAFAEKNLPPELGIYVAMIESEFCPCIQSATGPLGMFQLSFAVAKEYNLNAVKGASPKNPDDRCNPLLSAKAVAAYFSNTAADADYFGNDGDGVLLAIAGFNSGLDLLKTNVQTVRNLNTVQGKITFWNLMENTDKMSTQFQSENFKYVPKFLAAMIIGENPAVFGLKGLAPLSTS